MMLEHIQNNHCIITVMAPDGNVQPVRR